MIAAGGRVYRLPRQGEVHTISDPTSTPAQIALSPSNGPLAPAKSILILPNGTPELEVFHSFWGFIGVSPMTKPGPFLIRICSICGTRINIESHKVDADGHAVHLECYAEKVQQATFKIPCDPLRV